MRKRNGKNQGFTLIEISIVLVIIGLIVGGVLLGQDLISAAATRAQIAQIEKYNTAVNTFKVKFGYLPGDIPDPYASQFGFVPRGTLSAQGDGNGLLVGIWGGPFISGAAGETGVFWEDLSNARMIDGAFNLASETSAIYYCTPMSSPNINAYLPFAKIGNGNYVYVYNGSVLGDQNNYYGLSAVTGLQNALISNPGLTVTQAFNIDKKIDDGLPQSGNVMASYISETINVYNALWAAGGGVAGASPGGTATGSSTTCFDNGGGTGTMQYSMEISNGSNPNCALSFRMQGAAR